MMNNDLFNRMDEIHMDAISMDENSNLSSKIIDRYQEIDILVGKLVYEVEDQSPTFHKGTISWSPTYKRRLLAL